jgi:hypothetical protein
MYYVTSDMKLKYNNLLNKAHENLYKAVLSLPNASLEIREYLNQVLWHKISKVEHEIAKTKIMIDSNSFDDAFEENVNIF